MWLKWNINGRRWRPAGTRRVRHAEVVRWHKTVEAMRGINLTPGVLLSYWGPLCHRCPRPALWYRTRYIWHGKVHKWTKAGQA